MRRSWRRTVLLLCLQVWGVFWVAGRGVVACHRLHHNNVHLPTFVGFSLSLLIRGSMGFFAVLLMYVLGASWVFGFQGRD